MEEKIWRVFVSLGVPGIALGIFYMLFKTFKWEFPKVPSKWVGPIIVLFMFLTFFIVFYALSRYSPDQTRPSNEQMKTNSRMSIVNQKEKESKDIKDTNSLKKAKQSDKHSELKNKDISYKQIKDRYYDIYLYLPSNMIDSEIFIDGSKANIKDNNKIVVTIRVSRKDFPHEIIIKKEDKVCSLTQLIQEDYLKLYPCQP